MIKNKLSIWFMLLLLAACSPEWKDHYDAGQATVTDQTILEYIQGVPEYSEFASLLKEVGVEKIFTGSNQFTFWVPVNGKIPDLSGLSDSIRILTIANHISILPYTTEQMKNQTRLTSYSGKKLGIYSDDNVGFRVNDCRLVKTDMVCKDGVVHEINGWLELQPNLKDYLQSAPEYTILQGLINSVQDTIFDAEKSTPSGEYDVLGRPIYSDSVFNYVNQFYHQVPLDREGVLYTLFLTPDWVLQEAIDKHYKSIKAYTGENPGAEDSLKLKKWLVNALPYYGCYYDFSNMDYIYSLRGAYWNPDYQKLGESLNLSNGIAWQVSDLYIPHTLIWPSSTTEAATTYSMYDIWLRSKESINISGIESSQDSSLMLTEDPVVVCDGENGYKVTVSPAGGENQEPFNVELSWTLGKGVISGAFRQITILPGEYLFKFNFKKSEDLETDFDLYINDDFIARVNMADFKDKSNGAICTVTKLVNISRIYAETPTQITMRAIGGTGKTQVLSVMSLFFQPTANNY